MHHDDAPAHCVAVSLADFGVWCVSLLRVVRWGADVTGRCYKCEAYVKGDALSPTLSALSTIKFGDVSV